MKNGYNRYQVDDAISKLEEENLLQKKKLDAFEAQTLSDKKKYETLVDKYNVLLRDIKIKEKAANDIAQIALKEANDIIHSANCNADTIVKEALINAKEILVSISKLGLEAKEIKTTLNEQMTQLSNAIDHFDVPPIPEPTLINKCND